MQGGERRGQGRWEWRAGLQRALRSSERSGGLPRTRVSGRPGRAVSSHGGSGHAPGVVGMGVSLGGTGCPQGCRQGDRTGAGPTTCVSLLGQRGGMRLKLRRLPCRLRQQKPEAANLSRTQERVSHMISIPQRMLLCPHILAFGAQRGPELTSFWVAPRQWEAV